MTSRWAGPERERASPGGGRDAKARRDAPRRLRAAGGAGPEGGRERVRGIRGADARVLGQGTRGKRRGAAAGDQQGRGPARDHGGAARVRLRDRLLQGRPADAGRQLQTASWSDTRRRLAELQSPEEIGRIAAQRAARMLGARKVKTQKAAIIFEPEQAAGFLAGLSGAVNGDLVHKKSSFLAKLLGKRVASEQVTLVDDATLAGGLATRPFDGEGVVPH